MYKPVPKMLYYGRSQIKGFLETFACVAKEFLDGYEVGRHLGYATRVHELSCFLLEVSTIGYSF
jgi:hypothetical protein